MPYATRVGSDSCDSLVGMTTVQQAITELATHMFVGPVWPASILVCLMILYTLVALLGLIELDFGTPEVDLDLDVDVDPSIDLGSPDLDAVDFDVANGDIEVSQASGFSFLSGMLAGTIRWTNVGRMPMVIWAGAFTVLFWLVSYTSVALVSICRPFRADVWIPSHIACRDTQFRAGCDRDEIFDTARGRKVRSGTARLHERSFARCNLRNFFDQCGPLLRSS